MGSLPEVWKTNRDTSQMNTWILSLTWDRNRLAEETKLSQVIDCMDYKYLRILKVQKNCTSFSEKLKGCSEEVL